MGSQAGPELKEKTMPSKPVTKEQGRTKYRDLGGCQECDEYQDRN